jgi:ferredoxin
MKVEVDELRCTGHGVCESLLPAVFEVGDDGIVEVHHNALGNDVVEQVRTAVRDCPTQALRVHL